MKRLKLFEEFTEEIFEGGFNPPLLSVLGSPGNLNFFSDPKNKKSILLAQRDAKGSIVPGTTHQYAISGEYGIMGFDVELRNVRRNKKGDLLAEAKPSGFFARKLMGLLPNKNKQGNNLKTADGWLYILVPVAKLNKSISDLVKNQGKKAEIDAGSGVEVTLKYIGPVA